MKKIYILVSLCVVFIIAALIPTVYFMSGRYDTIQFEKNLDRVFNTALSEGASVKGDNNGVIYLISPNNIPRLYEVLSFTKRPAKEEAVTENKEMIKIDIYSSAVIEVLNYDAESDIAYIRMTMVNQEPGRWFVCEKVNLYEWVNKIVSPEGISAPNKRIGK